MPMKKPLIGMICVLATAATPIWAETPYSVALTVDQGWDDADRSFFYFAPQGSPILPFAYAKALEQPRSEDLFLDRAHLGELGMIFWDDPVANPEGLPIGLTVDRGRLGTEAQLGMNCSACHVTEIRVGGKVALVDGGVSHFDFWRFMSELEAALRATFEDEAKFARFAARLAASDEVVKDPEQIRARLRQVLRTREDWAFRNHTPIPPGPGRVDALNVILNQVTAGMLGRPENARTPDAPVSYPFLWDAPYLEVVQYNGVVPNAGAGALGRNVGQVLGVFGEVDMAEGTMPLGYHASVNVSHLIALEDRLETLTSPAWSDFVAEGLLPDLDPALVAQGAEVYAAECASCHEVIDREDRGDIASIKIQTFGLAEIGTDPKAALGFSAREVVAGPIEGRKMGLVVGEPFCEVTHGNAVLAHVVAGVVLSHLSDDGHILATAAEGMITSSIHRKFSELGTSIRGALGFDDPAEAAAPPDYPALIATFEAKGMTPEQITAELESLSDDKTALFDELVRDHFAYQGADRACMEVVETAQYRARPLNGIWATGPFLHNGSVPTLADLLKPAGERPAAFAVGDGEFDPATVGFVPADPGLAYRLDTRLEGNSNAGHEYGTGLDAARKAALLEYLKSL
jgi:hypothetical protein